MKNMKSWKMMSLLLAAILVVPLLTGGCKKEKQTPKDAGTVTSEQQARIDREYQETREKFDAYNRQIDQVKKEAQKASAEEKSRYDREIIVLEQKRDSLQRSLDHLREAGARAWESARPELNRALDELENKLSEVIAGHRTRQSRPEEKP